jgi:hypothetical protein
LVIKEAGYLLGIQPPVSLYLVDKKRFFGVAVRDLSNLTISSKEWLF